MEPIDYAALAAIAALLAVIVVAWRRVAEMGGVR